MSQLDAWLQDNFQLSCKDLLLNIKRLGQNASRYSKEHTLSGKHDTLGILFGDESAIEKYIEDWSAEKERSIDEDARGVHREGEDMQIANAITESNVILQGLGDKALLSDFPFHMISAEARQFFCRALQKEIGSSLRKMGEAGLEGGAPVYTDEKLKGILKAEFE